jgi:hypothetical protein
MTQPTAEIYLRAGALLLVGLVLWLATGRSTGDR